MAHGVPQPRDPGRRIIKGVTYQRFLKDLSPDSRRGALRDDMKRLLAVHEIEVLTLPALLERRFSSGHTPPQLADVLSAKVSFGAEAPCHRLRRSVLLVALPRQLEFRV